MKSSKLFLWSLYNFGGGIVEVVFILYFSQWLVIERGAPDFVFNLTLVASSALLLITAPAWSAIADATGRRAGIFRVTSLVSAVLFLMTGLLAALVPQYWILATLSFRLGLFFYLFAGVFWSGFLPDLASPGSYGTVSGWGMFGDWAGQMGGLLISLPLAVGAVTLFASGRASALVIASFCFLAFSLPALVHFRDFGHLREEKIRFRDQFRDSKRIFLELYRTNGIGALLTSFFFFNDAIITAANNYPLYLQRVFGVSDTVKAALLFGILIAAAVGSALGGYLVDHIGGKRALLFNLGGWIIILPLLGLLHDFRFFAAAAILMGIWFGSVWVIVRAHLARLTPARMFNRAFTYYTLMERFATLLGPLSWAVIVTLVPSTNGLNYRVAIISMAVFVIVGFFFAKKVPEAAAA
ncbi:MAG TPA: MFS transporter [Candidatus Paceibacterota bacterium]|nr:MFS transporter [Candidatus Paceibacterota bacterium]